MVLRDTNVLKIKIIHQSYGLRKNEKIFSIETVRIIPFNGIKM